MTSDFARLLRDLESLDGCPRTKRRFLALLARYAGRELYFSQVELQREARAEALRSLARERYSRAERVRILAERWGVTRNAARRWVPE